jgi:diguanylate cyclase
VVKPNEPGVAPLNDAEIARSAFKLLAERKVVPTPETFAEAFWESAGMEMRGASSTAVLKNIGSDLVRQSRMTQQDAANMLQAAQRQQWNAVRDTVDRALTRRPGAVADAWPSMLLAVLKQADVPHANWTRARKLDSIARLIDAAAGDPSIALDRLRRLIESWGPALAQLPNGAGATASAAGESDAPPDAAPGRGEPAPGRAEPAAAAGDSGRGPSDSPADATGQVEAWKRLALVSLRALEQAASGAQPAREKLRGYLTQAAASGPDAPPPIDWVLAIEREMAEEHRVREGLQRLLTLLCENLGQLAPDEAWLTTQLEPVRALLSGPIRSGQIAAAERRLSALVAQQTVAKRGLQEAKVALTEMLAALIEGIGTMGNDADRFHTQIGGYQKQLQQSPDVATLSRIVQGLLTDTQTVREQIDSSRAELTEARKKVGIYEARVSQLEHQLSEASSLAQKDPLTNALNRRGMDHAFRIESARAARYGSPLTLAMMDLDNFKQINDRFGHVVGDRALIHFVTTVHATLRPTDLTARSGGEEFCVLFPACSVQEGIEAVERLQRELTRRPFQIEQERLILTFSAGVAQWREGEKLEELMGRSDIGLYEAKNAGKNCVLKAA